MQRPPATPFNSASDAFQLHPDIIASRGPSTLRKTGGLADTVFDVDDGSIPEERKNGFVFEGGDERSLDDALDRGIEYCQERKEWWASMQEKVMKSDNSWERAVAEYERLYRAMQSAM